LPIASLSLLAVFIEKPPCLQSSFPLAIYESVIVYLEVSSSVFSGREAVFLI